MADKLRVTRLLDDLGVDVIEGGWPGSNPKDAEYFARAAELPWRHATLAAFGATRRPGRGVDDDPNLNALLDSKAPIVTLVGKSWDLHVTEALRTTLDENLAMVGDSIAHLVAAGRRATFDAEHFFDGYAADPAYALAVARRPPPPGPTPWCSATPTAAACPPASPGSSARSPPPCRPGSGSGSTSTTTRPARWPTRWSRSRPAPATSRARPTATASAAATPTCSPSSPASSSSGASSCCPRTGWPPSPPPPTPSPSWPTSPPTTASPMSARPPFATKAGLHASAIARRADAYSHVDPGRVGNKARVLVSELPAAPTCSPRRVSSASTWTPTPRSGRGSSTGSRSWSTAATPSRSPTPPSSCWSAARAAPSTRRSPWRATGSWSSARRTAATSSEATVRLLVDGERVLAVGEGVGPVHALDQALRRALTPRHPELKDVSLVDFKVRILDGRAGTRAVTRVLITSADPDAEWTTVGVSDDIVTASWEALADGIAYGLLRAQVPAGR